MLNGYAYLVEHPRRRGQDFVSCNTEYVAKECLLSIQCGWDFKVTLISFRGDGALPVNASVWDLVDHPTAGLRTSLVEVIDGALRPLNER